MTLLSGTPLLTYSERKATSWAIITTSATIGGSISRYCSGAPIFVTLLSMPTLQLEEIAPRDASTGAVIVLDGAGGCPPDGEFTYLPAGGTANLQIACDISFTEKWKEGPG